VSSAAGRDVWDRAWIGWDAAFGAAVAVEVIGALAELDGARRIRVVVLLVLLAGWYAAVGARALRATTDRLSILYLAGMAPLFLAAFAQYGTVGLLYFVLYPQVWALNYTVRRAIVVTVLLTVAGSLVSLLALDGSPLAVLAATGVQLLFAIAMGMWITGIVHQSADRRTMIAELEQARAELATVSHRAGVLAERERLAREIHDTLAQGFTSVVVLLELAESDVDTDPAAARRRLVTARETARQNLAEARGLVAALAPADLQVAPLPEALGRLADRFDAETGLPARFSVTGSVRPLEANQEVVLLRSAQEALANVRKHAGAQEVTMTLRFDGTGAVLSVADDGAGFDPSAPTGGFGLAGMRRRVEEIGGALTIHSGPGGTTAEVRC
jgi:signal transduction histidine kinase